MDPVTIALLATKAFNTAKDIVVTPWVNSAKAKNVQKQLQGEIDYLSGQKDFISQQYDLSKLQLETQNKQNVENLNFNIDYTQKIRDYSASMSAHSNVKKQGFAYQDLANAMANANSQLGDIVQNQALTGFRNSGSALNNQRNAEGQINTQLSRGMEEIKLSASEMAYQARTDYFSKTKQLEQYQKNLVDARENYQIAMSQLELDYANKTHSIDYEIGRAKQAYEEAEYTGWDVFLDILSIGSKGAEDIMNTYIQGKSNDLDTELKEYQLDVYRRTNGV